MKIEELNIAKKAITIANSIANVNEDAIVDFVVNDTQQSEKLSERLKDETRAQYLLVKLESLNKDEEVSRLIEKIESVKRRRKRGMLLRAVSSIAAIFILVCFIWNQNENRRSKELAVVNTPELVPLLITDNGNKINLQDLNGTITQESYTIEKEGKNVISYEKNSNREKQSPKKREPQYNEVKIPSKYMYKVKLEDGTQVTLNAGSSLRYPTEFFGTERCVELKGEGYFSVAKSDKPFIVKINNIKVQVYGTEFNIKTLNSGTIETVLVEGSIGVMIKDKKEVKMQPNQLLVYDEQNSIIELSNTNVSKYIQWLENNFNYVDVPFKDVIDDLCRWYDIDIKAIDNIDDIRITLFASRDSHLEEVFQFIEILTDVKFVKEGGKQYSIHQ